MTEEGLEQLKARVERGGDPRYHAKNHEAGKLFARERIARLIDEGSWVEEGMLANALEPELPADGVITGMGRIDGQPVAVMANDSTVKAGSWGARTVEKILRLQESAARLRTPVLYLVDSAGARITDQIEMFPGRRGAGRIFANQVRMSGLATQLCLLFGPSAAGGAYIPAFCDVTIMVEGQAAMYLGSPRMAEMVIGEKVTLEEMGGARMHCTVSGSGDFLEPDETRAIERAKEWLRHLRPAPSRPPRRSERPLSALIPADQNRPFDMRELVLGLVDEGSMLEVKALFAGEILTARARLDGMPVGIVANQPKVKGGVLFVDSADKAARFIRLCDADGIPLLYLADVPGFMIGSKVEREGIIRAGARMVAAVTEATVPRLSVIVRKAYGAGLYAMCGPGFSPDACIALPGAKIAVMGAEAAVNAVYFNKIREKAESERSGYIEALRAEYNAGIDIARLGSELVVDEVVAVERLREVLVRRFSLLREGLPPPTGRRHAVPPM